MIRKEDIVYYDFQGWPEYKMNLREVLMALGGKIEGDTISFDLSDPEAFIEALEKKDADLSSNSDSKP